MNPDFSKSELFELSAEFSNDSSSQLDENTFALSNLELDVGKSTHLKQIITWNTCIQIQRNIFKISTSVYIVFI